MTSRLFTRLTGAALFSAVVLSCATVPGPTHQDHDSQVVVDVPRPRPPRLVPTVVLDTLRGTEFDQLPPFAAQPLVRQWGPEPGGTAHPLRVRTYDLQHQTISVRFDWARHTVVGSTTLHLAALDTGVRTIDLDAVGMTIQSVSADKGGPVTQTYNDTVLSVHFARPLPAHVPVAVTITYEAVRPKKGAYFIDRVNYLWTQGETDDNRYWVPTYDSPEDKTTWEISVVTDTGERALSNGRLVSSKRVADGVQWIWLQDKPASTYLMSVVTGKYAVIQDHWHNVPVDYWVYPDSVASGRRGFAYTPHAMEVFSEKLGYPYPWAKYDQSAVPDFIFGGMENVTCTTQNDRPILRPTWTTPRTSASDLVAHELAHQWFGDLLTTKGWPHIWLNEGFATFMEQIYREAADGVDEGALDRIGAQREVRAADRRARRPLVYDRWTNDPIELFFSGHIYPKGATVMQMLRHKLGEKTFWAGMHRYVTEHAYQNVVSDDLRRALEEASKQDLKPFFDQWVYGAGFPVFQVSYDYDSVTQRLTVRAKEVQPRDSLTGYFDADVDVEVLTARHAVRRVMPVRGGTGEAVFALDGPPRSIHWNKGRWLLEEHDFPRPARMLAYQLLHDDDVLGRLEALDLLRTRGPVTAVREAFVQAATTDKVWAVRNAALEAVAELNPDTALQRSIVGVLLHDPDTRVRRTLIARFRGGATAAQLADLALHDPAFVVRGDALAAYLSAAGEGGLALADQVMGAPSWPQVLRDPSLQVLKQMPGATAQALYKKYSQ